MRSLLLPLLVLTVPSPAAAWAGGAVAPSGSGGTEFGAPLGRPKADRAKRPVASAFRVAPRTMVEGTVPRVAIRIDQRGVGRVRARVVFWPVSRGARAVSVDLGRLATGRTVRPKLPRGTTLAPGRYVVRLHAKGPGNATLLRRARASGRAALIVTAKPAPPPPPAPAPAPVLTAAPGPTTDGVFPVAGPHTLGGEDARFGAGRPGHIHQGHDILAAEGTPVVAPLAGTIVTRDFQGGGAGFYLVLDAADGRSLFFAHLQKDTYAVGVGQAVAAGQQLARVGSTGSSSGPHLHFEIWLEGWRRSVASRPVDPLAQLQAWDRPAA